MTWKPADDSHENWPADNSAITREALTREVLNAENQTILHCRYVSRPTSKHHGWVCIYPSTYLLDAGSNDKLVLLQAFNIPFAPDQYNFSGPGQIRQFTLIFPGLPGHWKRFHLQEETFSGNNFRVRYVRRNSSGIYHLHIH